MTWGTSIFLIAVGAVLKFAVTATTKGIDVQTVGVILMIVGGAGFLLSLLYLSLWRDDAFWRGRRSAAADPYAAPPLERERY
jgi:hypothetical protein